MLDMVRVRAGAERLRHEARRRQLARRALARQVQSRRHVDGRCQARQIGIVSRSASLTSEIVAQTSGAGLGQSTTVGIGADLVHGIGFVDCLKLFMDDDETEGVILVGEIGGNEEETAADYLRGARPAKPVVALVAGRHAPPERRMGHAGAFTLSGHGHAAAKIEALRAAGAHHRRKRRLGGGNHATRASGEGRLNGMSSPSGAAIRRAGLRPPALALLPQGPGAQAGGARRGLLDPRAGAAPARPPDRISPPHSGSREVPAGRAPAGARRRAAHLHGGSLRGGVLLCAFRHRQGR